MIMSGVSRGAEVSGLRGAMGVSGSSRGVEVSGLSDAMTVLVIMSEGM